MVKEVFESDIAIIGHFAKDIIEIDGVSRTALGGAVFYGGIAGSRMGLKVAIITRLKSEDFPDLDIFDKNNAILLGITVDNIPTLFAWIKQMGNLWFPVLSDFWPHGKVAKMFGVLRSDGVTERALFVIDKEGILRYAHVGDINKRPDLKILVTELEKLSGI